MAASTFDDLVTEGTLRAGAEGISTRVGFQLKKWLASQARLFLWPSCKRHENVVLAQGDEEFSIGSGQGGVAEEISRVIDPMKIFSSVGGTVAGYDNVRVKTDWDDTLINPFDGQGKPTEVRLAESSVNKGEWVASLNHECDQTYTMQVMYYVVPADPAGSAAPWYPNDRTIEQAVFAFALRHLKDPEAMGELDLLARMVAQDRMAEGMKPGINDSGIGLDRSTYR